MQHPDRTPTLILWSSLATCLLATTLGGCAAPSTGRTPRLLGHGTPGVLSYGTPMDANNAAGLLRRCDRTSPATRQPPRPQTLDAACDQLRRSMHNQPGNTVPPS